MASVQFIGRKSVVEAVNNRALPVWGLFQSKQFITAGEGADALDEFLKKLEPGGAGPVYTLKVYKVGDPEDITDKTECSGSFGFKLTGTALGASEGGSTDQRLDRIEAMLAGDDDDDEPDTGGKSLTDIVIGYLEDPQKLATIIGAFRGNPVASNMARMGSIEQVSPGYGTPVEPEDVRTQRLAVVLDRLERADPKILDHLEKLADLAENKPGLFKMLLMQLDGGL